MPARPRRARLGMTLEPLLGSTALYRADVSWNTSSELSGQEARNLLEGRAANGGLEDPLCLLVCVCVCERERGTQIERERESERERERESMCVFVCACV